MPVFECVHAAIFERLHVFMLPCSHDPPFAPIDLHVLDLLPTAMCRRFVGALEGHKVDL